MPGASVQAGPERKGHEVGGWLGHMGPRLREVERGYLEEQSRQAQERGVAGV